MRFIRAFWRIIGTWTILASKLKDGMSIIGDWMKGFIPTLIRPWQALLDKIAEVKRVLGLPMRGIEKLEDRIYGESSKRGVSGGVEPFRRGKTTHGKATGDEGAPSRYNTPQPSLMDRFLSKEGINPFIAREVEPSMRSYAQSTSNITHNHVHMPVNGFAGDREQQGLPGGDAKADAEAKFFCEACRKRL